MKRMMGFGGLLPLAIAFVLAFGGSSSRGAMGELIDFQFNEGAGVSTMSISGLTTGAGFYGTNGLLSSNLWSTAGGGVSALASDFSFDNSSASGMGASFSGPHLRTDMGPLPLTSNLTITGWFLAATNNFGRATFIRWTKPGTNLSLTGLGGGTSGRLRLMASPTTLGSLDVFSASEPQFPRVGEWTYFAVIVNGTSQPPNATFLFGSKSNASQISASTTFSTARTMDLDGTTMTVGSELDFHNPFQGRLDNIAVFTEALSLEQVEQLRLRALYPENLRVIPGYLIWKTVPGRIYHLEGSADLRDWFEAGPRIVGDGLERGARIYMDSGPSYFYRLRLD